MKPKYSLIKFETKHWRGIGDETTTECLFFKTVMVNSFTCKNCYNYRGTSGQRVKCAYGIDDKRRVM